MATSVCPTYTVQTHPIGVWCCIGAVQVEKDGQKVLGKRPDGLAVGVGLTSRDQGSKTGADCRAKLILLHTSAKRACYTLEADSNVRGTAAKSWQKIPHLQHRAAWYRYTTW